MKKNKILLSFDIEEFDLPEEYGAEVSENDKYSISAFGTERILEIIERTGVKVTFFITADFAQKFPELLNRMVKAGCEIASHGLSHSSFSVGDLAESKRILEGISGEKIIGFRMARLAPVEKTAIRDAGYQYESSLNPVWLPGRYSHISSPLLPFYESCGLLQFPVSAVPGIRFPLFWLSFKNLPMPMYLSLSRIALNLTGYFNLYTHPWEFNSAVRDPRWKIPGYVTRHAGEEQGRRLTQLIESMRKRGTFITFNEWSSYV